ncbi:hypothetical protein ACH47Z_28530 [Streptomyces sp. NPDC020192]|uniref:hypothetical protein n=1 Tax=Streptomyces sp. NPDC020192 TaxID=3365066 RepID=UPI0037B2C61D
MAVDLARDLVPDGLWKIAAPLIPPALLTVLFAAALAHPDPQVRARAERIIGVIFRARWSGQLSAQIGVP